MLSDKTRDLLKEDLCSSLVDIMFGDGMEAEYVCNGMQFKGLNNMTDEELVEEYESLYGCDEDDDEDMEIPTLLLTAREEIARAKLEKNIDETLSKE